MPTSASRRTASARRSSRPSAAAALVAQLLVDLRAAAHQRVEHRERVLEDHPELATRAACAARAPAAPSSSGPAYSTLPSASTPGRQQADERPGGHRLAAAGLADDADRLAARERRGRRRTRSCRDSPPMRAADREPARRGASGSHGLTGARPGPRAARTASRRAGSRSRPSATSTIAGASAAIGFWKSSVRFSASMRPQSAVPGPAPRPRNESAGSATRRTRSSGTCSRRRRQHVRPDVPDHDLPRRQAEHAAAST